MELHIFVNEEFGKIRTITCENGTILFCGNDVAKALGYSQPAKAVREHCNKDGCLFQTVTDKLGRKQKTRFITEGNVYQLILRSKLDSAEKFGRWVVDIVLPSIRKFGAYLTPDKLSEVMNNPDNASKLFNKLRSMEEKITQMEPKAEYYNALVDTQMLTNIRQTAKELRLPEKLFTYLLLEMGFAYRTPKRLLMPYAFMVNYGYAELKEYTRNGHGGVYMLFTPKGKLYLMKRIGQRLALKAMGDK